MSAPLLANYPPAEKTAYVMAIAAITTADNSASDEEIEFIDQISNEAGLSPDETERVRTAARDTSGTYVLQSLDLLKKSDLRYSLVADLIALAEADSNLSDEEKKEIESVANYLKLSTDQLTALTEYAREATVHANDAQPQAGMHPQSILENNELQTKLQSTGINLGSVGKGLLGMLGPMILGGLLSKGLGGKNRSGGGGLLGSVLGSGLGGMLGGGGSTGGANTGGGGALGSLIGGLTGGRGLSGMGGFLKKLLK